MAIQQISVHTFTLVFIFRAVLAFMHEVAFHMLVYSLKILYHYHSVCKIVFIISLDV